MTQEDKVFILIKNNGGYLTAKTAKENGVENVGLQRMCKRGVIDRVAHGLYVGADIIPDPYYVAQYRCPKGVFSHETALFLLGLCDRTPFKLMMTIPSGWNSKMLSDDELTFFYASPKHARLGAAQIKTASGLSVTVYDSGRTICDCLRNMDKLDKDLVLTALKRYIKTPGADKVKMLDYAAVFKIRDIVMRYMEVLS